MAEKNDEERMDQIDQPSLLEGPEAPVRKDPWSRMTPFEMPRAKWRSRTRMRCW
jgi:hypothetical protein